MYFKKLCANINITVNRNFTLDNRIDKIHSRIVTLIQFIGRRHQNIGVD